jgi:hypothetical protein
VADCPLAPPSRRTTHTRCLHRACIALGGVKRLAVQMQVDEFPLLRWLNGEEEAPESVFLAALEIVLLDLDRSGGAYLARGTREIPTPDRRA